MKMSLDSIDKTIQEMTDKKNNLITKVKEIEDIINDLKNFISNNFNENKNKFIKEYNSINSFGGSWKWEGERIREYKDILNSDIKKNYSNQTSHYSTVKSLLISKKNQFNEEIAEINRNIAYWQNQKSILKEKKEGD